MPQIAAIETAAKEVEAFTKLFDGLFFFFSREVGETAVGPCPPP